MSQLDPDIIRVFGHLKVSQLFGRCSLEQSRGCLSKLTTACGRLKERFGEDYALHVFFTLAP